MEIIADGAWHVWSVSSQEVSAENIFRLQLCMSRSAYGDKLKGTNRGKTQTFADCCRFSPFPRKQRLWEAQLFANKKHWYSQANATAENPGGTCWKSRIGIRPLRFVPFSAALVTWKSPLWSHGCSMCVVMRAYQMCRDNDWEALGITKYQFFVEKSVKGTKVSQSVRAENVP